MNNEPLEHLLNPLIDENPIDTLANIQAMLAKIQIFAVNGVFTHGLKDTICPATDLYGRLLMMVGEAIDYEINRLDTHHNL